MTISWINVDPTWQLQDVQAGLTIVIAILSTVAIFSFVQFIWQHGTSRVRRHDQASLASLLSVHNFREAWDVLCLLKLKLFRRKHWMILLQCLIVVTFTTLALLSGPLARSATRRSVYQTFQDVTSWNVSRSFDVIAMASWDWTNIANRLDNASFPLDLLLDELPDVRQDWKYRPAEWNFTWSISCVPTKEEPIVLHATGECTDVFTEIPSLLKVIDPSRFDMNATDLKGYWTTSSKVYQHILGFLGGTTHVAKDNATGVVTRMNMSIAAVHMTNATKAPVGSACWFAKGEKIPKSSFTRIDCGLVRSNDLSNRQKSAFPDTPDMTGLIQAYNQMYQGRFMREGATNSSITMIKPRDLQRFYQTYVISKDSQQRKGHAKKMTVDIPVTQISTAFIVCWSTIATACLLIAILSIRHYMRHVAAVSIPDTKLEWMLQAIEMSDDDEIETLITQKKRSVPVRGKVRLSTTIHGDDDQSVQEGYQMRAPRNSSTRDSVSLTDQRRSSVANPASKFEDAVFVLDRSDKKSTVSSKRLSLTKGDTAYTRQKGGRDRSGISDRLSFRTSIHESPYSRLQPPAFTYTSLNNDNLGSYDTNIHSNTRIPPFSVSEPQQPYDLAMPRPQRHSQWRNKVLYPLDAIDDVNGGGSSSSRKLDNSFTNTITNHQSYVRSSLLSDGASGFESLDPEREREGEGEGGRYDNHSRNSGYDRHNSISQDRRASETNIRIDSRITSLVEDDIDYYERGVGAGTASIGREFV